ncbi:MAG: M1 family metallopeptidase, partial [Acidimicrobiales bacterium]|nr:M1 family metallopeptidase [Acidimicrobiales bacterium]
MTNVNNSQNYEDDSNYRLPKNARPIRYDLLLAPDLNKAVFTGSVVVELEIQETSSSITCNGAELEVIGASISNSALSSLDDSVGEIKSAKNDIDETLERLTFNFETPIEPGRWFLKINFQGILNDKLRGFYKSTFVDETGNERIIATTHCEATDARRAFPCWDEPDLKAVFSVKLDVDQDLVAISNWPETKSDALEGNKKRVFFGDTIKMSTYLVAFIVGPMEVSSPRVVDGIELRVIHVPGKSHMAPFALDIGEHSLKFFAEYFDIPYPGKKLDLIALPDFAFGAMENLGAVTFRETALLADPITASRSDYERVADVVAHEIAHMWFGDLVTMKWWNGIWLNEAFATFMEMLCVDAFRPDWERWVTFGLSREAAMGIDSLANTRPIEFPVRHPSEAEGMFDVLTYQKGAAVLRMLEQFISPEVFRDGIRDYLKTHAYSNTETSDLWDALESASKRGVLPEGVKEAIPVREMMDSWIFQGGYPLVSVKYENSKLSLSQSPFQLNPNKDKGEIGNTWLVPVKLSNTSKDGTVAASLSLVLESEPVLNGDGENRLDTSGISDGSYLSANTGGTGFYRVLMDASLSKNFISSFGARPTLERFNYVCDAFATTIAGLSSIEEFMKVIEAIGKSGEKDSNVWAVIASALKLFEKTLGEADQEILARASSKLISRTLNELTWQHKSSEPENYRTLRNLLLSIGGTIGKNQEIIKKSQELFEKSINSDEKLDPDLASAILETVATNGGESDYEAILNHYKTPDSPQDEQRHLFALALFRDSDLIERTLDLSMTEVRTQNAPFLIQSMLIIKSSQKATFEFLEANYQKMSEAFPSPTISRMLDGLRGLSTLDESGNAPLSSRAVKFIEQNPPHSGKKTVDQALERL